MGVVAAGRILPVSGYEEKIVGTANEQQRREQVRGVSGGVANVIVPAGSMEDGELVEVQDLPHTALPVTTKVSQGAAWVMYTLRRRHCPRRRVPCWPGQVCVPRWVTSRARVLAADTLFDVIGLSLLPDNDKPKGELLEHHRLSWPWTQQVARFTLTPLLMACFPAPPQSQPCRLCGPRRWQWPTP